MNILDCILIIIGIWQMAISFLINTENAISAIVFKVIPFFMGMYCIIYVLIQSGLIIITTK